MKPNEAELTSLCVELRHAQTGWKKISNTLRSEGASRAEAHRIISSLKSKERGTVALRDRVPTASSSLQRRSLSSDTERSRGPMRVDSAWYGLAVIAEKLRQCWRERSLGDLGTWSASGAPQIAFGDFEAARRFVRGGGVGYYNLNPSAVQLLLRGAGLEPLEVITDLVDRHILLANPGHRTYVVSIEGKKVRRYVLCDIHVRSRSRRKVEATLALPPENPPFAYPF